MRKSLVDLGVVVACALFALGLVAALAWSAPEPALAPFDSKHRARIRKTRPHVVLMGNSMVYTRFDRRRLNELVHLRLSGPRIHENAFEVCKARRLDMARHRSESPSRRSTTRCVLRPASKPAAAKPASSSVVEFPDAP